MSSSQPQIEFRPEDVAKITRMVVIFLVVLFVVMIGVKSVYTVQPNEQAVVLRFGKYQTTADPGLHFCIPLVDQVLTAPMEERSIRMPFDVSGDRSTARARQKEDDFLMLTGDLNAAAVEWTVQWRVSDPRQYLFTFYNGDDDQQSEYLQAIISQVGRTVMNRLVGDYSIDEVLTEKRGEIGHAAKDATQRLLDEYECGVTITALQMQRITPPSQVRASFAAVQEAVQTQKKLVNEANKLRNERIPKANADRDKAIQEAKGYADRRRAEVKGEIDALMTQYEQFSKAPDETKQRLYLEAMERVLSGVKDKTIIDSDLKQLLPLLNLNEGSR